jgi:hypothetical protein
MQANRDEFEAYVWHALGAVAEVCRKGFNSPTRIQILGSKKTSEIAFCRCVFVRLIRETVGTDREGRCSIDLGGEFDGDFMPLSFPTMSRLFGHHHSTFVLLNKRAHREAKTVNPLVRQAIARLAETWGAGECAQ